MQNEYAPPRAVVADVNRQDAGGITDTMLTAMRGTKPWVLLVGVVVIIMAAMMLLGALGTLIGSAGLAFVDTEFISSAYLLVLTLVYGIMGSLVLILGIYLLSYSKAIGRLIISANTGDMENALCQQHKFWRLAGILMVVSIVMAALLIIALSIMSLNMMTGMEQ